MTDEIAKAEMTPARAAGGRPRPGLTWRRPSAGMLVAGAGVALLLLLVAFAWRLTRGPVATSVFTPAVERLLALQVRGGRARIAHADIVWSARAKTIGLALRGVSLSDGRGRTVLTARRLEFGWAAGSLAAFRPAMGRVAAQDFFAAISASPRGRYELGFEAAGAPRRANDLAGMLGDLAGRSRRGRPLSYLREVELSDGVVDLRQIGAPLAWRGKVQRVLFHKGGRRLDAAVDLTVGDGPAPAILSARGQGAVGLGQATVRAWISGLDPARVFPSVGATRSLSALDAPVAGRATIGYASDSGVRAADIALTAGQGRARFGQDFEPFQAAEFRAVFDPASGDIVLSRLRAASARADFDMTGVARLIPGARRRPASLALSLHGQNAALVLSGAGAKQAIASYSARGRWIPATGRLEIADAQVVVGDASADARGVLIRGKPGQSVGVDLDGRLRGSIRTAQLMAFWPDGLSREARSWLVEHVMDGRIGDVSYGLRLPPGAVAAGLSLRNPWVRVDFHVADGQVLIRDDMPRLVEADGHALLEGDRFHMDIARARLNGVTLSAGTVDMARLSGPKRDYVAAFKVAGPVRGIAEVIDAPGDHVLSGQGLQPAKFTGAARADVRISRPIGPGYGDRFDNYDIRYKGVVSDAALAGVALGVDLKARQVEIEGSEDQLSGKGAIRLGPYRGPMDFSARFAVGRPPEKRAVLHGMLDMSQVGLGGPAGAAMAFDARLQSRGEAGEGVIASKGFTGKADWRQGPGGRILVQGRLDPAAWRAIGLPVSRTMPSRTPTRLELRRTPAGWSGQLAADAYSGTITLTAGPTPRLRYVAELSPAEARQLGLQAPAFSHAQPMVIEVSAGNGSGSASYAVGPMKGQVAWLDQGEGRTRYDWHAALTSADLHAMGLPAGMEPRGPVLVDLSMTGENGAWSGTARTSGASLKFSAAPPVAGLRILAFSGPVEGATLNLLGLVQDGMVVGPMAVSGQVRLDGHGLAPGHLDVELTRAALNSPTTGYRKPAGRPLKLAADFSRGADGAIQASRLRADGPGVSIDASASLRADAASTLDARVLKVDGVYDGALRLSADDHEKTITARGRFFDARPMIRALSSPNGPASGGPGSGDAAAPARPVRLDLDLDQVRVSDRATLHRLRASGTWGDLAHRRLDVSAATPAGSAVSVHLTPDAGGGLVSGRIGNMADAADSLIGVAGFAGGSATVQGRLRPEGADLEVEMRNVRIVKAPVLAQILTLGSLRGMADTMNGEGISFARIIVPMRLRGSRLMIDDARATGGSMGLTARGVVDIDRRTMDVSGAVAPAYGLNAMLGAVPLIGELLVSKKGEGVFGLTYSARGSFAAPKVSVNPLSLAAPGILRRMFEGKPKAELEGEAPRPASPERSSSSPPPA